MPAVIICQTGLGSLKYDDFKKPEYCGTACHNDFYQQWKQAMMSQAYTHEWDEIEYFKMKFILRLSCEDSAKN